MSYVKRIICLANAYKNGGTLYILKWPDRDMFRTHEEILADAYYAQEKRIAYDAVEGFMENAHGGGDEA